MSWLKRVELSVIIYLINFFVCLFSGMHRKSLEAAEALKNDDSGNSDREDAQSKASDVSSTGGNPNSKSQTSHTPQQHQKSSGNGGMMTPPSHMSSPVNHESMSSRHSVTPTSSTGPASHNMTASPSTSSITGPVSTTPPLPPSSMPVHHLTALDSKRIISNSPHTNFHHESDSEAFRWVDYNRDPISFIRCDISTLFLSRFYPIRFTCTLKSTKRLSDFFFFSTP